MTLQELLTASLQQLDRGTDAQTLENWRDKLTRYLNDAVLDLSAMLKPRRTDNALLQDGKIDLSALPRRCVKVLTLTRGARRFPFYYGAGTDLIHVPAVSDGEIAVCYRYLPEPMRADTDEPDLPEMFDVDGAIILYAVGRERAAGDAASIGAARGCFELYQLAKRNLFAHAGEAEAYRFENRY